MALQLEQVYRMNYPLVYRRVSRFFHDDEIEEQTQNVFLKIAQTLGSFDGRSSITTWIYAVTTNHCLNKIRDQKRHAELLEQWSSELIPHDIDGRPEDRTLLNQIWEKLDEDLTEVAFYYYVDGMTQAEIAETIGATERTVRNRLQRLKEAGAQIQEQL